MVNVLSKACLTPVLIAPICSIDQLNDTPIEKFKKDAENQTEDLQIVGVGVTAIYNASLSTVKCHNIAIEKGRLALFGATFLRLESSYVKPLRVEALLLENRYVGFTCSSREIAVAKDLFQIITIGQSEETQLKSLFAQFDRYLEEYRINRNEYLLAQRKKFIPDFIKYCSDQQGYREELSGLQILSTATEIVRVI